MLSFKGCCLELLENRRNRETVVPPGNKNTKIMNLKTCFYTFIESKSGLLPCLPFKLE